MTTTLARRGMVAAIAFAVIAVHAVDAEAQRGGGGYSRAGPAASGGFAYSATMRGATPGQAVGRGSPEITPSVPQNRPPVQDMRQDAAAAAAHTVPCSVAPTMVGSEQYYRCGAAWYSPGYADGGIVYQEVPAPPGY